MLRRAPAPSETLTERAPARMGILVRRVAYATGLEISLVTARATFSATAATLVSG